LNATIASPRRKLERSPSGIDTREGRAEVVTSHPATSNAIDDADGGAVPESRHPTTLCQGDVRAVRVRRVGVGRVLNQRQQPCIYEPVTPVRHLREQASLTQQLLADLSGVTQQTISRYETGTGSPTLKMLNRLAEAVGLHVIVSFTPVVTDGASLDRAVSVDRIESGPRAPAGRSVSPPGDLWTR
jgi:DNA-binding XRE family transcriptional regulator